MKLIRKYFPEVSDDTLEGLRAFKKHFLDWNEQINCVSRKDAENLEERHILHSLGIAKALKFEPEKRVLDLGTGGGFPGLPLAILFPETQFVLVDSIGKKIKVVREVAHELGLENVQARHLRVEELSGNFNYLICRAVAPTLELRRWIRENQKLKLADPGKWALLKGGDLEEEVREARVQAKIIHLRDFFSEPFFETKAVVLI